MTTNLSDVSAASKIAEDHTAGRLRGDILKNSRRKVVVKLAYLVVDAKPEYTKEEITTDDVSEMINRRIETIRNVIASDPSARAFAVESSISKETIKNLDTVSKRLPVVLEIESEDWSVSKGETQTFTLKGDSNYGDAISELIDFKQRGVGRHSNERTPLGKIYDWCILRSVGLHRCCVLPQEQDI